MTWYNNNNDDNSNNNNDDDNNDNTVISMMIIIRIIRIITYSYHDQTCSGTTNCLLHIYKYNPLATLGHIAAVGSVNAAWWVLKQTSLLTAFLRY